MKITIREEGEFSGKLTCTFVDDTNNKHHLYFDLEDWTTVKEHGVFGGNYMQIFYPEQMNLHFGKEYTVDVELGRKIYKTLFEHGWEDSQ
ncbi:MAG TPA: hypothetical protein VMX17_00250 [Candidatus Glassbacteria bacterium]|nr:hypothetical protein [Candidatus Glassbacteria bacterium]